MNFELALPETTNSIRSLSALWLITPPMTTPLDINYTFINEYRAVPKFSENEILDVIAQENRPYLCYKNASTDDIIILDSDYSAIYIYKLETFTESRSVEWAQDPWEYKETEGERSSSANSTRLKHQSSSVSEHSVSNFVEKNPKKQNVPTKGNKIEVRSSSKDQKLSNSSSIGEPPSPWSIPFVIEKYFQDSERIIEIPDTASYSKCSGCRGDGWKRCWRCSGRGTVSCVTCSGTGRIIPQSNSAGTSPSASGTTSTSALQHLKPKKYTLTSNKSKDFCFSCSGRGRKRCQTCDIEGKLLCEACKGCRGVKNYIKLTIKYTNHVSELVYGSEDFPNTDIDTIPGEIIFEQTQPRITPLEDFAEEEINEHSQKVYDEHMHLSKYERIIQQRHSIKAIPYVNVKFKDKRKDVNHLCIYGCDKQVIRSKGNSSNYHLNPNCLGCILN